MAGAGSPTEQFDWKMFVKIVSYVGGAYVAAQLGVNPVTHGGSLAGLGVVALEQAAIPKSAASAAKAARAAPA